MKEKMDLTGKQFGDWTVLYELPQEGYVRKWMCRCVCGVEKPVFQTNLTRKLSAGCGCRARAKTADTLRTHGKRYTRLYTVWCLMRYRCYNPQKAEYKNYGGRGIAVCDEWLGKDGFQNFWDWAYANGYDEDAEYGKCTLDRIDVNGNYCPENCRWVDMRIQAYNKRDTVRIDMGGEQLNLDEFCSEFNVPRRLAYERIRMGWTPTEAWFFPPKDMSNHIEYNGEVHSQRGWAKIYGISHHTFQYRITHGWSFEQAVGIEPPPPRNR